MGHRWCYRGNTLLKYKIYAIIPFHSKYKTVAEHATTRP